MGNTADRVAMPTELLDLLDGAWAIRPSVLQPFLSWVSAGSIPVSALGERPDGRTAKVNGGTAVLTMRGPISRRPTPLSFLCGGASVEELSVALRAAVADPAVARIVLDIDSPGGTVDGVPELAREIFDARSKKPITAFVDSMAASAAYWLASQASELVVTPSGQVGSIGVFSLHVDYSKALEAEGIKPTFIHAGKFKVEANPYEPLGDEAKGAIQSRIDAYYGMFVHDVARGRGLSVETVRAEFGEGRMVLAKDAVKRGMADAIRDRAHGDTKAEDDNALIFAAARAAVALAA